jgi:hypothetical protein
MGIWKDIKAVFRPKKKENHSEGLEDFAPLNIQKMNENIDPKMFQEGRSHSNVKEQSKNQD